MSAGAAVRAVPAGIARSWLLHPASALMTHADVPTPDALVLDIEDAVPQDEKSSARHAVVNELEHRRSWVRINDAATRHWFDDLDAVGAHPGLAGVMLAKAETADDVARTAALLAPGIPIVPMIESAAALQHVEEIASHPDTFRIAFGVGDFMRDTGISADPIALGYVRTRIVVASVAAGIASPIDGPARGDAQAVASGLAHSRAMGFTGALVLDAATIPEVDRAFTPSEDELLWAHSVLQADPNAPRNGSYAPTLARAHKTLRLFEQLTG